MEADRSSAALDQTITTLQGGVLQVGVGSSIPAWEGTLAASGRPELTAVSENLATLRTLLASGNFDPTKAGGLLQTLGSQTQAVAPLLNMDGRRGIRVRDQGP
jgi:hypothetical protein